MQSTAVMLMHWQRAHWAGRFEGAPHKAHPGLVRGLHQVGRCARKGASRMTKGDIEQDLKHGRALCTHAVKPYATDGTVSGVSLYSCLLSVQGLRYR